MSTAEAELLAEIDRLRSEAEPALKDKIITVMSPKGGQGKSTLAKEISWLTNTVLADFDWDGGRVSRLLGYQAERRKSNPLLDALTEDRPKGPRLYRSTNRPDMIPGHRDFEVNQPSVPATADLLVRWTKLLDRGLVVDTHPGGSPSTLGAAQAADLIVMPVVLGTGELDAVEETLREDRLGDFPVLLVPNMTPSNALHLPARHSNRLLQLSKTYDVAVADTMVRTHRWMTLRMTRTVVSAAPRLGARSQRFVEDMVKLSQEVIIRAA